MSDLKEDNKIQRQWIIPTAQGTVTINLALPSVVTANPFQKSVRTDVIMQTLADYLIDVLLQIVLSYDCPFYPSLRAPFLFFYDGPWTSNGFPSEVCSHTWFQLILRRGDLIYRVPQLNFESMKREKKLGWFQRKALLIYGRCFSTSQDFSYSFITFFGDFRGFDFWTMYQEIDHDMDYSMDYLGWDLKFTLRRQDFPNKIVIKSVDLKFNFKGSTNTQLQLISHALCSWLAPSVSRFVIHRIFSNKVAERYGMDINKSALFEVDLLD